jgi:Pentapeptide repeats (9 copies)
VRRIRHLPTLSALTGALWLVALAGVPPALGASDRALSAREFAELVVAGSVVLRGVRVDGDVDLGNAVVGGRMTCADCRFDGDFLAEDAKFKGGVDLAGSDISGDFDLVGSIVQHGLRAQAATFLGSVDLRDSDISGNANFAEARFEAPMLAGAPATAGASGATFNDNADFSRAAFGSITSFEGALFFGSVNFTMARFETHVVFADGASDRRAAFSRAIFGGSADFSDFDFGGKAVFEGAQFPGPAVFSGANFEGQATFDRTRFGQGATFLTVTFPRASGRVDSFAEVQSNGDLNFSFAEFNRPADFEDMAATGAISFEGALLTAENGLHFLNVSAGEFDMDVDSALAVVKPTDQVKVLALIESSAKARDELSVANDAHYARHVLESRDYWFPVRVVDFIFYREFAGYFVRPFNPLVALLVLAASMTLLHVARGRSSAAGVAGLRAWGGESLSHVTVRASHGLRSFGHAYVDTLSLAGRAGSSEERQARRIEILVYRVLLVCALIGFANSNPTLRQMFDAVS